MWTPTSTALVEHMQRLLKDPSEAAELSEGARHIARERFGIERFARDWDETFRVVAGRTNRRACHGRSTRRTPATRMAHPWQMEA